MQIFFQRRTKFGENLSNWLEESVKHQKMQHYIHLTFSSRALKTSSCKKETIMEIRSTRSFNAIPANEIRGVYNFCIKLVMQIIL